MIDVKVQQKYGLKVPTVERVTHCGDAQMSEVAHVYVRQHDGSSKVEVYPNPMAMSEHDRLSKLHNGVNDDAAPMQTEPGATNPSEKDVVVTERLVSEPDDQSEGEDEVDGTEDYRDDLLPSAEVSAPKSKRQGELSLEAPASTRLKQLHKYFIRSV